MLANKDSSGKKNDTKRGYFFSLFYVSLLGFIFLSGTMLSIPSSFKTQPVSLGVQDADAQQYYPSQMGYDDKSYGGDSYYSNAYDNKRNDKSYDNNNYDYGSHDKKRKNFAEIEKFDNKLFVCENGIVVDDRINCPIICPLDTDLPGVVVLNEANCNIFEVCDASSTPLGQSLGQDVKVADSALCQLSNIPNLQICEDGPFEGFAVNDQDVCDTLDSVQICGETTDLPGVLTTDPATCNIFEECNTNTPLRSEERRVGKECRS